jgi:hypothetical protein
MIRLIWENLFLFISLWGYHIIIFFLIQERRRSQIPHSKNKYNVVTSGLYTVQRGVLIPYPSSLYPNRQSSPTAQILLLCTRTYSASRKRHIFDKLPAFHHVDFVTLPTFARLLCTSTKETTFRRKTSTFHSPSSLNQNSLSLSLTFHTLYPRLSLSLQIKGELEKEEIFKGIFNGPSVSLSSSCRFL